MIEITLDDAIEFTRALAEEKGPEFVYEQVVNQETGSKRCVYVKDGKPDCIVGQYLASKGVPVERLKAADGASIVGGINSLALINRLKDEGVVTASTDANLFLSELQYRQDNDTPWMTAVNEAERYVKG